MNQSQEHGQTAWRTATPKKIVVAKLVVKSNLGNILLVKPTYKKGWQFPGGAVELKEAPSVALVREVKEELGLAVNEPDLKSVGVIFQPVDDAIIIIYELSTTLSEDIELSLQVDELATYKFVSPAEVADLVSPYYQDFWAAYN